jgi:hypothetical protein
MEPVVQFLVGRRESLGLMEMILIASEGPFDLIGCKLESFMHTLTMVIVSVS